MASAIESFKLPRGMGRLKRFSRNGPWTWEHWDARRKKHVGENTGERNRSNAEQFVYQQIAVRAGTKFRAEGIDILFTTVVNECISARTNGHGCTRLRASSLKRLGTATNAFQKFVASGYDSLLVNHVDGVMLQQFVEREARRVKVVTANMHLDCIVQFLKFALDQHFIVHVPEVKHAFEPANDESETDDGIQGSPVPTRDEVRRIIEAAKVTVVPIGKTKRDGRRIFTGLNQNDYGDLFAALCLTGMRIGEATYLTWDDVDWSNRVIHIRPGRKNGRFWRPKTKSSIRRIALVPELEVILKRLRRINRRNLWVFETKRGTQLHAHNVEKRFRLICEHLRFEKHFVPHSLRKYWASTVAQQGMDWKVMIKMFGHSDFKLILSTYYAQNDYERIVAEATKIDFGLQARTPDANSDTPTQGECRDGSVA